MKITKTLLSTGLLLIILFSLPAILLAGVLLFAAETPNARLFAAALFVFYAATIGLIFVIRKPQKSQIIMVMVVYAVGVDGMFTCYMRSPEGQNSPESRLQSVFPTRQGYVRWSPANLVPEIDQMKLGALFMPYLDPYIDQSEGVRLKHLFMTVYREMQADPEFVAIGSVLHYAYAELVGLPFDVRHLYVYIPEHPAGQKLPVILFLHGSLGNFKGYLWAWKQFADAHQFTIVAPSFGFGNWHKQGGTETIEAARQYCLNHPDLDGKRIILAGLSNGGIGVSRAAVAHPQDYQGLVYISSVIESEVVLSDAFRQGWQNRPILVIHGSQDDRIPKEYIEKTVIGLAHNGIQPDVKFYEDEDHFLVFSKRTEFLTDVLQWLQTHRLN